MAAWESVLLSPGVAALLLVLFLLATFWILSSPGKSSPCLPPGPVPLPFIGNLHLIDLKRQDSSFMKLSEKYGPVFTVHFGLQKAVVLTGYEAVKESLLSKGDEFIDRPDIPIFVEIQHGNGIFFSERELWRSTRRFTLSNMRDLGMGTKQMEEKILEELHFLIEEIKSFQGKPFPLQLLSTAPTNITFSLLFGSRFDYADPTFQTLLKAIEEVMSLLGSFFLHVFNVYPFLGFLFKPHKMILRKIDETCIVLKNCIQSKRPNINENNLNSYIDALLFKQQEEKRSSTQNIFHDDNILASVLDLVMAGTETTATTLQWAILLMMKYPDIQRKVQEEIQGVLGSERLPTAEDRRRMPFANAVAHEVQRFASIVLQFPRRTAVDTHFRGYFIPKGTTVIPSLTSVMFDKTQWETPHQFNPGHFLDSAGNFVKRDAFLPFSTGCSVPGAARLALTVRGDFGLAKATEKCTAAREEEALLWPGTLGSFHGPRLLHLFITTTLGGEKQTASEHFFSHHQRQRKSWEGVLPATQSFLLPAETLGNLPFRCKSSLR
ncbi:Cytochrome P450 2W1 [Varanus komodoensis]|nr:Cytochrome P450 2W1 [Varanus komodoensis]